jgi:tetratricopeptide (TPR) repeat protein
MERLFIHQPRYRVYTSPTTVRFGTKKENKKWQATALYIQGTSFYVQSKSVKALDYYTRSLKIDEEIDDKKGMASSLNTIGLIYKNQGAIAQALGAPALIKNAANSLSVIYEKQGEGIKALEMYKLHIQMRDSIQNDDIKKQIAQTESRAEFEKETLIKEQEEKESARIEAEKIEQRNTLQFAGIGIGIFALFGLVFFLGRVQLPKWAVELSVFLPFLIFFEFLLVITDSTVDSWSSVEPAVKLLLNVVMAGAIFPLHSIFERLLKKRLFKE